VANVEYADVVVENAIEDLVGISDQDCHSYARALNDTGPAFRTFAYLFYDFADAKLNGCGHLLAKCQTIGGHVPEIAAARFEYSTFMHDETS